AQVRLQVQSSEAPAVLHHRLAAAHQAVLEAVAVLSRGARLSLAGAVGIGSEQASVVLIQPRADDVWLGLEGRQHFTRIVRIVEGERGGAVGGDRLAEDLEIPQGELAK